MSTDEKRAPHGMTVYEFSRGDATVAEVIEDRVVAW